MTFNTRLPVLLLCGSALLGRGSLAAQPGKSPTQPETYKIQVKVNSVLVTVHPVPLKGRAWISQDAGEVKMALAPSNLADQREGMVPVRRLPPQSGSAPKTFFFGCHIRRSLRQLRHPPHQATHRFSHYLLFCVQTTEEITKPKSP
jgi:hypothetical protein